MMCWLIFLIFLCFNSLISCEVICFVSKDTILLEKKDITQDMLDHYFAGLLDKSGESASMCYLVLTFFRSYVRVQFYSSNWRISDLFAKEPSLMARTSIDYTRLDYIQTQLVYTCSSKRYYCNQYSYYELLSGELLWLFHENYTQLGMLLKPILYKMKNESDQKLECFVQGETNATICKKDVCFGHQINNVMNDTSVNCGIPKSHSINQEEDNAKVKMNIETRLCLNGMQYFEFFYTCNVDKCNGIETLDQVRNIILLHYNISNLQWPVYTNDSTLTTNYCQVASTITLSTSHQSTTTTAMSTKSTSTTTKKTTIRSTSATKYDSMSSLTQTSTLVTVSTTIPQQSSFMLSSTTASKMNETHTEGTSMFSTTASRSKKTAANRFAKFYFILFMILFL